MRFPLQTIDQLKPLVQGFRKQAGLTQAAMAEKLGITQQSYAQIEANLASTSVERLYTILRLLNVELGFVPSDSASGDHNDNLPASPKKPTRSDTRDSYGVGPGTKLTKIAPKVAPQAIKQSDKTKW